MLRAVIDRPISVGVAALALVVLGFFSLLRLPVSLLPTLERPRLTISVSDTERSREELVQQVAEPLERRMLSLDGVLEVASTIDDGQCLMVLDTEWQTDVDRLRIDAERRLADIAGGGVELTVSVEAGDVAPILEIAVSGGESAYARTVFADKVLLPELGRLSGAGRLQRLGGAERRPVVRPYAAALAARGLTAADLEASLREVGDSRAIGRLRDGGKVRPLTVRRSVSSLAELEALPVGPGRGMRLGDVAGVAIEEVADDSMFRWNGEPGVLIEVHRAPGANAVLLARQARQLLGELAARSDGSLRVHVVRDSSREVVEALVQLGLAGLLGLLLGALVLRWMLGSWRPTLALAVVVPASVVTAFGGFYLWRVSLDVVSLAGLALAAGMLIDNSIVVLEAIEDARARGVRDPEVRGTRRIALALVASFLTTVVVFLPLIYLRGLARAFFGVQAFSIVATLAVSLLLSLSLTPVLARRFGRGDSTAAGRSPGRGAYLALLDWALASPRATLAVALLIVAAGFGVLPSLPRELVPAGPSRVLSLDLRWPGGTARDAAEESLAALERSIAENRATEVISVYRGSGERRPASIRPGAEAGELDVRAGTGEVTVIFADAAELTRSAAGVAEALGLQPGVDGRPRIRRGAVAAAVERGTRQLEVEVSAATEARARRLAERTAEALRSASGATVRIAGREHADPIHARPALVVDWDAPRLARLAAAPDVLAHQVRAGLGGYFAGRVDIEGIESEILVEATLPADLGLLPVKTGDGSNAQDEADEGRGERSVVPLTAVATIELRRLEPPLERRNGRPAARLILDTDHGERLPVDRLAAALAEVPLAADERARLTGQSWEIRRSFTQLRLALTLALILVFLTVAALYESFALPWVVMATVPVAAVGALGLLRLSGQSLSVMSFLGLILLAGIVVNNAIVLVHRSEQRVAAGRTPAAAIREAAGERYRPILMTTLTTLLAMIPLAVLGGEGLELRRALATAVCGGLTTSTFAALLVVPVLYRLLRRQSRVPEGGS